MRLPGPAGRLINTEIILVRSIYIYRIRVSDKRPEFRINERIQKRKSRPGWWYIRSLCAGVTVHVRPRGDADESVGRDAGQLPVVRHECVRDPDDAHRRRSCQGADDVERQVHVPAAPDAQPGHVGVKLLARDRAYVQLVQVPGRLSRVYETLGVAADGRQRRRQRRL